MVTTVYLVRHARSVANDNGMFGGITDYPLSANGKMQTLELADKFKNIRIDVIYSSPLQRAIQTIEPIAKKVNQDILIHPGLIEINVGIWENKLKKELGKKVEIMDETGYYAGIQGQESMQSVADRMEKSLLEIVSLHKGKTLVIASHINSIRPFLCKILNIPFQNAAAEIGDIPNISITLVEHDGEKFNVKYVGKENPV